VIVLFFLIKVNLKKFWVRTRIMKAAGKVVLLISLTTLSFVLGIHLIPQIEAQTLNNNTQTTPLAATNFTREISQQISTDTYLVNVAYESPKTVVLQGSDSKEYIAFNDLLWRAVDLLKDKGFVIDQIDLLRTGEITESYRIYMSQGE
jgi:hypothetical protein